MMELPLHRVKWQLEWNLAEKMQQGTKSCTVLRSNIGNDF